MCQGVFSPKSISASLVCFEVEFIVYFLALHHSNRSSEHPTTMALRSAESPMDFEWNTGHGPIDQKSPFLQRPFGDKMQSSTTAQKRMSDSTCSTHHLTTLTHYPGTFKDFNSPQKPHLPTLSNQTSFMSNSQASVLSPSTPSTKPAHLQFRQSSFTTPQREFDLDFSSGMDNESSPGADNEDTPEQPVRQIVQFSGNPPSKTQSSPTKPYFTHLHTPGRGEIARRPHFDVLRRVNKKRRRDADRDVRSAVKRRYDDSDGSDSQTHRNSSSRNSSQPIQHPHSVGVIPSVLSFIDDHPRLPATLSYYAQFLLNLFVVLIIIYAVSSIYLSIREDFRKASSLASSEVMAEMAACASEYQENNCKDITARVPAMRSVCESWERCMSRDPRMVGRAKVSAKTFAEILSSFVDGVSVKALGLGGALFIGCWAVGNLSLSWVRAKVEPPVGDYGHKQHIYGAEQEHGTRHGHPQRYGERSLEMQGFGGFQDDEGHFGYQGSPWKRLEPGSPVKRPGYR